MQVTLKKEIFAFDFTNLKSPSPIKLKPGTYELVIMAHPSGCKGEIYVVRGTKTGMSAEGWQARTKDEAKYGGVTLT